MRRDAERNRKKLIEAARHLMRAKGADVSMEAIAAEAGLTRGTLYRNFAHRYDMYEAVLEDDLAMLVDRIAADEGEDRLGFIRYLAEMMMSYDRFLNALADLDGFDLASNHRRIVAAIAEPLAAAKGRGAIRRTISESDIVVACRMLASNWQLDGLTTPHETLSRRLDLMIRGVGSSRPA